MKKIVFIILALVVTAYLFGCTKKEQSLTEMQEPISVDGLDKLNNQATTTPEVNTKTETAIPKPLTKMILADNMPSSQLQIVSSFTSTIQTALTIAGYYTGAIDGKIGPQTTKAIKNFQKAHNLEDDGEVGLKTWGVLSPYLNPETVPAKPSNAR